MTSPAILTYWNGRGTAETIRLMLEVTGEVWTERVYGSNEGHTCISTLSQLKTILDDGVLCFDQLPLLQIDGLNLVQNAAIVRYLARKHNMYGANAEEAVQCDIIAEGITDFKRQMKYNDFGDSFQAALDKYFPRLQRVLKSNRDGTAYLVGDSLTFVDIQLVEVVLWARENHVSFAQWPMLDEYFSRVIANPRLTAYLASDRRYPFPGLDGYYDRVKAVMPWLFGEGNKPEMSNDTWMFKI